MSEIRNSNRGNSEFEPGKFGGNRGNTPRKMKNIKRISYLFSHTTL